MSDQLAKREPITIDLYRPQSAQPQAWQMQAAPDEYEMPMMPTPGWARNTGGNGRCNEYHMA